MALSSSVQETWPVHRLDRETSRHVSFLFFRFCLVGRSSEDAVRTRHFICPSHRIRPPSITSLLCRSSWKNKDLSLIFTPLSYHLQWSGDNSSIDNVDQDASDRQLHSFVKRKSHSTNGRWTRKNGIGFFPVMLSNVLLFIFDLIVEKESLGHKN